MISTKNIGNFSDYEQLASYARGNQLKITQSKAKTIQDALDQTVKEVPGGVFMMNASLYLVRGKYFAVEGDVWGIKQNADYKGFKVGDKVMWKTLTGYKRGVVEAIKDSWYTVKSIPDNVDPKQLMEIFCTAIKEKNFKLYQECIYPERSKSERSSSLLRYHWDLHQARFRDEYVHVIFDQPKITVQKGYDSSNDLENFFLDESQKAKINQINGEREELAIVMSRAFDQNGKQRGSKNSHELRRKGNGRWYVNTYDIRF